MDEEAGENKDSDSKAQQAEDGKEWRDGFGHDGENCERAIGGKADGTEMLQIESDAQPLGPGRKDRSDGLPSHQHNSRDDRIPEEQAESEKDRAIAEASESRDEEIGT